MICEHPRPRRRRYRRLAHGAEATAAAVVAALAWSGFSYVHSDPSDTQDWLDGWRRVRRARWSGEANGPCCTAVLPAEFHLSPPT